MTDRNCPSFSFLLFLGAASAMSFLSYALETGAPPLAKGGHWETELHQTLQPQCAEKIETVSF